MKRVLLCCGVLMAACSLTAVARQNPRPPVPEGSFLPPPATAEARPSNVPVATPPLAKAATITDLLDKLDSLKVQKAALEKAEKETVALLKKKLEQQKDRLKKLGVAVEDAPPAVPVAPLPPPGSLQDGPR